MKFNILFISAFLPYTISLPINYSARKFISNKIIEVAALGRVARLGDFYDARTDRFMDISLYKEDTSDDDVHLVGNAYSDIDYVRTESLSEKAEKLDISASLSLSLLGGKIAVSGSGKYFMEDKKSFKSAKASLVYKIRTAQEHLKIFSSTSRQNINKKLLKQVDATHVVVGIEWGANVVLSLEDTNTDTKNSETIKAALQGALSWLIISVTVSAAGEYQGSTMEQNNSFSLQINGDIIPNMVPQTMTQSMAFIRDIPKLIRNNNKGKGKMMKYILMPLATVQKVIIKDSKVTAALVQDINKDLTDQFMAMFQEMKDSQLQINEVYNDMAKWTFIISEQDFKEVSELKYKFDQFTNEIKKNFANKFSLYRGGKLDVKELKQLINEYKESKWISANISKILETYKSTMDKIALLNLFEGFNALFVDSKTDEYSILGNNFMKEIRIISIDLTTSNMHVSSFYVREIVRLLQVETAKESGAITYYIKDDSTSKVPKINVYIEGNLKNSFAVDKTEYVILVSKKGDVTIMDAKSYDQTSKYLEKKLEGKSFAILDNMLYIIDSKTGLIETTDIKNIIAKPKESVNWTLAGSFPKEKDNDNVQSVAAVNGSIFYFITYKGLLYQYDAKVKTVAKRGNLPAGDLSAYHSLIIVEGILYIHKNSQFYSFNGTDLTKLTIKEPRMHPGLFELNGQVCRVGGEINDVAEYAVHCYNPKTGESASSSLMNEIRRYPGVVKTTSGTMVFGGARVNATGNEIGNLDSVEILSPVSNTWSYIPTPPGMLADIYSAFSIIF